MVPGALPDPIAARMWPAGWAMEFEDKTLSYTVDGAANRLTPLLFPVRAWPMIVAGCKSASNWDPTSNRHNRLI
jgi:hypothetical protein